jgi:hypothetical protein
MPIQLTGVAGRFGFLLILVMLRARRLFVQLQLARQGQLTAC